MRSRAALSWVFLLAAGCHTYAPVKVHAYDAVTMRPLEGVAVEASARYFMDAFHPKAGRAVTDARGDAIVSVCTNYRRGAGTAMVSVALDGYVLDYPAPNVLAPSIAAIRDAREGPYRVEVPLLTLAEYRRRHRQ